MTSSSTDARVLRVLIGMAAITLIVSGLRAAGGLLAPVALAAFLALVLLPPFRILKRHGVPSFLAIPSVALLAFGALAIIGALVRQAAGQMRETLPTHLANLAGVEVKIAEALSQWGIVVPEEFSTALLDQARLLDFAGVAVRGAAGMMSQTFLVMLLAMFILSDMAAWPAKIRSALGRRDLDLRGYARISRHVQRYLGIKTLISLATGIAVGVTVWAIGLDYPVLWALIAFLLNFVPTVGSIVAAVPGIAFALLQLGVGPAVGVAIGYIVINVIFGNILEPMWLGRGDGLSALTVVVSMLFWGWVWGPIGMVLSFPLTLVLKIVLENQPSSKWVAVLLGPKPPEPAESV